MNPYLDKLMPECLHIWLRRIRVRLWLIKDSFYNIQRQMKYSSTFNRGKEARLIAIMVMTHVLEKGITMPERRLGFGQDRVREILRQCNEIIEKWGSDFIEIQTALADLKQYREIHKESNYQLPKDIEIGIDKLLPRLNVNDENCYTIRREDYFESQVDFKAFAESRHSIRWFSTEPVNKERLLAALQLAQTAPSACNRQATRVKIIETDKGKKLCCSLQNGVRGFGDKADKWLLITTEMGAWSHVHNNSGVLDAGIYVMNLLYALHYYGIVACPLNAHLSSKAKKTLQKEIGIPKSEFPVAFIVIGNPVDEFMVPKSRRIPVTQIVDWK